MRTDDAFGTRWVFAYPTRDRRGDRRRVSVGRSVYRDFGDDVYVVGHGASLGTWKPQEGVLLRTHIECYPATW